MAAQHMTTEHMIYESQQSLHKVQLAHVLQLLRPLLTCLAAIL